MKLGIGVVTYNRKASVLKTIESIQRNTDQEFNMIVSDDGSNDGTASIIREMNVKVISGQNAGVCWNKNRALFYLHAIVGCDVIILLEDDVQPRSRGWQRDWVAAALSYGHMNFAGHWFSPQFLSGIGSAEDPIISNVTSGQCTAFSREALSFVGFLDTRFKGYGYGHVEHSKRLVRSGYGGRMNTIGRTMSEQFYLINSDLEVDLTQSFKNPTDLQKNSVLFKELQNLPIYRSAWSSDNEMFLLRKEIETSV